MKFGQIPTMLIALAVVCTGLALTFDLAMPLGVAAGVPYALLVLIGIWFPKRRHVLLLASVVSLLVVAGYLFSPKGGQDWVVLTNRALALGMIWLTAFLICFLKTAQFEGIEKYRYLVQASPVCIHEIDLEGKLVSMNPAGLKMMDANDISEIRGLKYLDIPVAEDQERISLLMERAKLGEGSEFEFSAQGKSGLLHFSSSFEPIKDEDGKVIRLMGVTQDITIRKQAEKGQKTALVDAERANQSKSMFLSSMSHELRTPMNAVLGFAQMLQFNPKAPLTPEQNEHVESIISGGHHLLELINDILDLTRIEADQTTFILEDVIAQEVIDDCLGLTAHLGQPEGIVIECVFRGGDLVSLRTDRTRFKQILLNLLSNAVKYNKEGGTVVIDGYITDGDFLHLSVTDTGVGISERDQSTVFMMFHQLGADPEIARKGTGIGLTVTKLLIEKLAGRIGVESESGVGSTFWLELPLSTNDEAVIWNESLRVGIDAIDKDHQALFSLTNKAVQRDIGYPELDEIIEELIAYTKYHFTREEAIMEVCQYPDLEAHRNLHRDLVAQVENLSRTWRGNRNRETLHQLRTFLRSWWIGHISDIDVTIAQFADEKGEEIAEALNKLEI
ncbi:MAG: bacteriohemerythrin [Rhodospirillaceae bacterium]|nr:bacteriohemerythrin [Rhodospirillaceae bacterium]